MAESRLLVIDAGFGLPGPVERILAKSGIDPRTSADLGTAFLEDVRTTADSLTPKSGIRIVVRSLATPGQDPGTRMAQLFEEGFADGADSLCVIGMMAPHLPAGYILEAFGRLTQHRQSVVLGPATGSYYLLGASGAVPYSLWKDISWQTPNVLKETLQRAVSNELSVSLLPSLQVVDSPEQLQRLARDLRRGVVVAPRTQSILRNTALE